MPRSASPPPRTSREDEAEAEAEAGARAGAGAGASMSHSRRGEEYRNGSSSSNRGFGGPSSSDLKRERYENSDRERERERDRYREGYSHRSSRDRDREEDRRRYRRYDDEYEARGGSSSRYERDSASRNDRPREERPSDRDREGYSRRKDDRIYDGDRNRDRRSPVRSRRSPPPRTRDEPASSSRSAPRSNFEEDRRRERERYDATSSTAPSTGRGAPNELSAAAGGAGAEDEDQDQDQPDFKPSGLLAKESNQVNGTALKYHEPPEAKKPKRKWRMYVFKDGKEVDLLHLSRQSCYLFGRDQAVVDVPLEHTSCSKQHAVLQYRLLIERNEFGDEKRNIKPYLLDLASANGTTVNKRVVPASRFYELKNGDTIQFGGSEREYVLLCED